MLGNKGEGIGGYGGGSENHLHVLRNLFIVSKLINFGKPKARSKQ